MVHCVIRGVLRYVPVSYRTVIMASESSRKRKSYTLEKLEAGEPGCCIVAGSLITAGGLTLTMLF